MGIIAKHIVEKLDHPIRFEAYCLGLFPQFPSKKGIRKAIKSGTLLLNGKMTETSRWLKESDCIELLDSDVQTPKTFQLEFPVIYEDEYLAVINKPAGFITSGNQYKTIANALSFNIEVSKEADAMKYPKPVHRLDSPTSGLLIASKTQKAHMLLGRMFEQKTIQKTYHAIVQGKLDNKGIIQEAIEGQTAITEYESLQIIPSLQNEYVTWLKLHPKTGRTHQLRIHLAQLGHPIIGDKQYGTTGNILKNKGLFLAAIGLDFIHPITKKELSLKMDPPHKFYSLMEREQRRWKKFKD